MQLSVSSGKDGILQRATFLTFGDSLDHTSDYPLADMVSSANRWVQKVASWIWKASGTWEFDDSNQTDLPSAVTTLVASQQDYALPANALEIFRVEVKDSGGNWVKLKQLDQTEVKVALTEFEETAGLPHSYDVRANSLFLYPAPASASVTLVSGLRLYFSREALTFSVPASYTTADTTQPGFNEDFHDIVTHGIAYDFLQSNDQVKAKDYYQLILFMKQDLDSQYGARNKDKKVGIKPRVESYL